MPVCEYNAKGYKLIMNGLGKLTERLGRKAMGLRVSMIAKLHAEMLCTFIMVFFYAYCCDWEDMNETEY